MIYRFYFLILTYEWDKKDQKRIFTLVDLMIIIISWFFFGGPVQRKKLKKKRFIATGYCRNLVWLRRNIKSRGPVAWRQCIRQVNRFDDKRPLEGLRFFLRSTSSRKRLKREWLSIMRSIAHRSAIMLWQQRDEERKKEKKDQREREKKR